MSLLKRQNWTLSSILPPSVSLHNLGTILQTLDLLTPHYQRVNLVQSMSRSVSVITRVLAPLLAFLAEVLLWHQSLDSKTGLWWCEHEPDLMVHRKNNRRSYCISGLHFGHAQEPSQESKVGPIWGCPRFLWWPLLGLTYVGIQWVGLLLVVAMSAVVF